MSMAFILVSYSFGQPCGRASPGGRHPIRGSIGQFNTQAAYGAFDVPVHRVFAFRVASTKDAIDDFPAHTYPVIGRWQLIEPSAPTSESRAGRFLRDWRISIPLRQFFLIKIFHDIVNSNRIRATVFRFGSRAATLPEDVVLM